MRKSKKNISCRLS